MAAQITEYMGNKVITLSKEGSIYPFSFGVKKALLIVENYKEVLAFVKTNAKTIEPKIKPQG